VRRSQAAVVVRAAESRLRICVVRAGVDWCSSSWLHTMCRSHRVAGNAGWSCLSVEEVAARGVGHSAVTCSSQSVAPRTPSRVAVEPSHVLLLSVDGMHQRPAVYVATIHARRFDLVRTGTEFTAASTPFPSDSFRAWSVSSRAVTPRDRIYYDPTPRADRSQCEPGRRTCPGYATPDARRTGAFDESADRNSTDSTPDKDCRTCRGYLVDDSVAQSRSTPLTCRSIADLPAVYPHSYLKVNTVSRSRGERAGTACRTSTRRTKSSTVRRAPASTTCSPRKSTPPPTAPAKTGHVNSLTNIRPLQGRRGPQRDRRQDHSGTTHVGMPRSSDELQSCPPPRTADLRRATRAQPRWIKTGSSTADSSTT